MDTADLLARVAGTLRTEIGPATADEYARTQAFMAAVILERLGRERERADHHAAAAAADGARLRPALVAALGGGPPTVQAAVGAWIEDGCRVVGLGPVIEALYAWDADEPSVVEALGLIRPVLRRDIDRRMEIAS